MSDETQSVHEDELGAAIAAYLEAGDRGQRPAPADLLARYPHLAEELEAFLAREGQFAEVVGPFVPAVARSIAETVSANGDSSVTPDEPPGPGAFGPYDLEEMIGEGGMGVVYKARHRELKRVVALKLIHAGRHATRSERERFRVEAEAAARLSHPGIVQLYEVGEHDGQPFLASEFCAGGSLAAKLGGNPRPATEAARTVADLAAAVQAAHDARIVHRDLKPANVLVTADGRLKIGDFGLAKLMDSGELLTLTNAILGSPPYMSPEQAAGTGGGSYATDVYSLGAILYELLTGDPPFEGATAAETVRRVVREDPVPPRRRNRAVPRDLQTICLRCLEKNPARRFASARELGAELGRFLRGEPIRSRPVGPLGHVWRWCGRNVAVACLLGAVACSLVAGTSVSGYYAVQASDRAENEATARTAADMAAGEAKDATRVAGIEAAKAKAAEDRAVRERDAAIYQRYAADCARFQIAWEQGEYGRLHDLLNRWLPVAGLPDPRGWEWHYLRRQCDQRMTVLGGHRGGKVPAVEWHPGGRLLLSAGFDGLIKIWDAATGELVRECEGHASNIYSASWSRDGAKLASCGLDGAVIVWDAADGKVLHKIDRAHAGQAVHAVVWKPDGLAIASIGHDKKVRVWETSTGKELHALETADQAARRLAWSGDGRFLAMSQAKQVVIWETTTWTRSGALATDANGGVMAWSPDSRRIAFGSVPVTVWDVASGQQVRTLTGAEGTIHRLAWGAHGQLAAASRDQTVRVWDTQSAKLVGTHRMHWGVLESVAWSPDGKRLVSSDLSGSVRLYAAQPPAGHSEVVAKASGLQSRHLSWSSENRLIQARSHHLMGWHPDREFEYDTHLNPAGTAFAASPNGSRVAAVTTTGECLVFDSERGELIARYSTPISKAKEPPHYLAFSGDGRLLAAASRWSQIHVWEATTGRPVDTLAGSGAATDAVFGLAWHPTRDQIAASGQPGNAQVLNRDGSPTRVLAAHAAEVYRVRYGPDGRLLASASADGDIIIWDTETGRPRHTLRGHVHAVYALAWTADGRRLASGSADRTVRIWDVETGEQLLILSGHGAEVHTLAWDRDSGRLASGDAQGEVRLWSARTPGPPRPASAPAPREAALARWSGHTGTVRDITISADGKLAVSCSGWPTGDGTARVWEVAAGKEINRLRGTHGGLSTARFVGAGHQVLVVGLDRVPRLWDANTGRLLREFPAHPGPVESLDVAPDGLTAVTGGTGRTLWVWDLRAGRRTKAWLVPPATPATHRVLTLAITADGKRVLSGGDLGHLLHIELDTGRVIRRFGHGSRVEAAALSPDEKFAVSAGGDGRVVAWDLQTGSPVREFRGHGKNAQSVAFSPDGRLLVTTGKDATVRLWEFATGKELHVYRAHNEELWAARFTPDGRRIISGGGRESDFDIRVFAVPDDVGTKK